MNAELRDLFSNDVEDLAAFQPATGAFRLSLRAMIGPVGGEGEESFDFAVCSLAWLKAELESFALVAAQDLVIVERFDLEVIEAHVRRLVSQASGPDWPSVAGQLAQWSRWEFEDYRD